MEALIPKKSKQNNRKIKRLNVQTINVECFEPTIATILKTSVQEFQEEIEFCLSMFNVLKISDAIKYIFVCRKVIKFYEK